jgi:ankyrin repeat protein
VGRGFPPVTQLLLDHGADVNARYGDGLTALMWAAGHSDDAGTKDVVQVVNLLVDRGAKLDEQDDKGRTALMLAAMLGHTAAAEALLARGADRTLKDKDGKTASDLASGTALRAELAGRP